MEATKNIALCIEPISGSLTMFYAFINGTKVIQADGTQKRLWSGKVPDAQIRVKIRVVGIDNASFQLGINLPDSADNQNFTHHLQGGYYEKEIIL